MRERLEAGQLGARAVLDVDLAPFERAAVGRMLLARWSRSQQPVSVRELRRGLEGNGTDLESLLEALGGPLVDRRAEKRAAADRVRWGTS